MNQVIYCAADHAGFEMKEYIKSALASKGYRVIDCGALTLDPEDDYPSFMRKAATSVVENPGSLGILFGGSGQGEAIVANRITGVRAAVYYGGPKDIVRLSREHNDANILSLGARFLTKEEAEETIEFWLSIQFTGEARHVRRIAQIN